MNATNATNAMNATNAVNITVIGAGVIGLAIARELSQSSKDILTENKISLGIHATLDLAGGLRLGPDEEYVERLSYDIDYKKRESFYNSVAEFLPFINPGVYKSYRHRIPRLNKLSVYCKKSKKHYKQNILAFLPLYPLFSPR